MKKMLSIILVLLLTALLTGCAMLPAENEEAIRHYNFGVSTDNVCYLETEPGVELLEVNGRSVYEKSIAYVGAGRKSLVVRYSKVSGNQYWSSSPTNISFDFEAGKYYIVDSTVFGDDEFSIVNFTINEITDPSQRTYAEQRLAYFRENLLKLDAYLAFSKENPTYFEGTWVTGTGKTLEFTGNEFKFSETPGSDDFSGRFIFNENTAVIDVTKLHSSPNNYLFSLYYERDGNRLSLSGKGFVGLFMRAIIDDYFHSP
jgi:hypothetical protein